MRISNNFVQNTNYSQQKNTENKQNKQKMGFGAINMAELKETMSETAFDHLKDSLTKGGVLAHVANAVKEANGCFNEILRDFPNFNPSRKEFCKFLNTTLTEHNLHGEAKITFKDRGLEMTSMNFAKKIPEPVNLNIKVLGKAYGSAQDNLKVAEITVGGKNLHDKLVNIPAIKKIQQYPGDMSASYFILEGKIGVKTCEHSLSSNGTPVPADEKLNEFINQIKDTQSKIAKAKNNLITDSQAKAEILKNEKAEQAAAEAARKAAEEKIQNQDITGNQVSEVVNSLFYPRKAN